ncbi:MAG: hypothetical protein ABFR53_04400 [Actinomycetota bacterium]
MVGTGDRTRSSVGRLSIGMVAAALFLMAIPHASAQTGAGTPVASGEFTGVVGLDGGFSLDLPTGGEMVVLVNGTGPLELTLADGTMSGTWSLAATQSLAGDLGAGIKMSGGGPIAASGAIGGPPGTYTMTGTYTSTNTATVETPIATQSATTSDSGPVDVPLNDVLVLCDTIVGRWDFEVKQDLEAAGFNEFIHGYFSATTGVDATEQAEEVEALIGDINTWASSAPGVEPGGTGLYIGTGLSLLTRAQTLQSELSADTPCPPDPTFMTDLSLAAQDALSSFVDRFPGFVTPAVVALALGSGAIGEGSPAPGGADALQAQMEAAINETFDSLVDDFGGNESDIINMARSAQMLGMETMGSSELSPSDVLLVLGAE